MVLVIETITLNEALELFDMPRTVGETDDFGIIKANYGHFGPYIWNGKKKGKGQKNITIKKIFGEKPPADLTLAECKKAVAGKLKPKAKPRKKKVVKK